MTEVEFERCLQITKRLRDLPIAIYFQNPVDEKADGVPGYFERVKRPMDISKIIRNLTERRYTKVEEWKKDIEQIHKNSAIYHGDQATMTVLAAELVDFAERKLKCGLPKTEWEMWAYRVAKTQKKLSTILESRPSPASAKVLPKKIKLRVS